MKNKIFSLFVFVFALFLPTIIFAATCQDLGYPNDCANTPGYGCIDFTSKDKAPYDIIPCHCGSSVNLLCAKEKIPSVSTVVVSCAGENKVKLFGECVATDSLDGMVGLALAATKFMLGMVGSISLLAFVWGGFQMVLAAGDSAKVKKGRDSIVAAVIGLIIVFTSYILVQFVMTNLLQVKV
ncbi:MAG: hypothetical protein WCG01_00360 [bacterium]